MRINFGFFIEYLKNANEAECVKKNLNQFTNCINKCPIFEIENKLVSLCAT